MSSEIEKRQSIKRPKYTPGPTPFQENSVLAESLRRRAEIMQTRAESSQLKTVQRDLSNLSSVFDVLASATSTELEPITRREKKSGLREACVVTGLSDVHADEFVRAGETPTGNEYNPDIAERSIERYFDGVQWLIDLYRRKFLIRDVIFWLGGDLMSGHIHEELKENTARPPLETLLWLRPRLVAGIDQLLADSRIERILIPCSYGNHGRTTAKPFRALGASHSYEWVLYQWLASLYEKNPRVQFLADRSAHQYVKAYDFDLHFHHGDETNYQGGVGGITIPLNKAVAQWDQSKPCDYHHFGHWHQYHPGGRIVVNGSVIGYNAYAMSIKASPEPPQQFFYLLDSKRGKTCSSPIWVRD